MAQWDTGQSHSAAAGGEHQHTESADTHSLVATLLRHHHDHHHRQPHQPAQQAEQGHDQEPAAAGPETFKGAHAAASQHHQEPAAAGPKTSKGAHEAASEHHQEPAAAGPDTSHAAHEAASEHAQRQAPVNSSAPTCAKGGPAYQAVLPEARQEAAVDEAVPSAPMWPGPAAMPAPAAEVEAGAEVSAPSPGLAVTTAADILAQHLESAASRAVALAEDRLPHEPAQVRVVCWRQASDGALADRGSCCGSPAILDTRWLQSLCCWFCGALAELVLHAQSSAKLRAALKALCMVTTISRTVCPLQRDQDQDELPVPSDHWQRRRAAEAERQLGNAADQQGRQRLSPEGLAAALQVNCSPTISRCVAAEHYRLAL